MRASASSSSGRAGGSWRGITAGSDSLARWCCQLWRESRRDRGSPRRILSASSWGVISIASGEVICQFPALDGRADGQLVRTKAIPDQVVDALRLLQEEVTGAQAPVAAPGNGLGAHHRGARPPRQAEQLPDAGAGLRRTHVVCIIAEATVAPARSRRRVRALAAAARQLRNGDIPDSRASEGGAETSFAKLWHRPRSAQLPDVRDDADALLVKEREELVQRSVRMADGDDPRGPRQCPRSRFCIVRRTVSYPRSLKRSRARRLDRKSTRLNSSHRCISYAVFCLKK